MNKKQKICSRTIAIFLALLVLSSATLASAHSNKSISEENMKEIQSVSEYNDLQARYFKEKRLSSFNNKSLRNYKRFDVKVNGKNLAIRGFVANGVYYIPFRVAANAIGLNYKYDSKNQTAAMSGNGLFLSASAGAYSVYANDRPLFETSPSVIMSDGRMYISIDSFAKAVGMRVDKGTTSASISGKVNPLLPAGKFYREDDVFWLARIIHAEAKGESLLGKIAVGNVVLNRVESSFYPNTIYGVIFDKKYGVQFSPVLDGSIYNAPAYDAYLAAKICLEGSNISDDTLFFLNPRTSTSAWIPNTREYMFSIGKHDFYK